MMGKQRIRTIALLLALVILTAAVSWFAGSNIRSPAEVAARTAPPAPSPILVPVEERVLTSDIVTRGTARFGLPQSISIVPSALKPGAGVITTLPERDTQLKEGDVLLTASGRPVFVLQGEIPAYRDLVPGISGDDVRQLEGALKRLGFDPGPVDGTFDNQTSAAVADWYTSAGWQPFGPTADQLATIRTLEQELAVATNNKLATEDATSAAPLAVDAARAKAAEAASEAARLEGQVAIQAAVNAQRAAEREAKTAGDVATRIAADLEVARRRTGVQIPADEIVFLPALPVRVEETKLDVGDAASGPVMTVTNNQLAVDSSLPLDEAPLVKPGMLVAIDEPDLGIKASGVVARVAAVPGTDGVDGYHIYFEVRVDETRAAIEGASLRLTIPVKSTGGKVVTVPVSALSLAADGTSRVQVDNNGSLEFIAVEPGLSAGGFVEVTPVDGTLAPGQLVVIGYE